MFIKNKNLGDLLFIANRKLIIVIPIYFKYWNFSARRLSLCTKKLLKFKPVNLSIRLNKINKISTHKRTNKNLSDFFIILENHKLLVNFKTNLMLIH